MRPLHHDVRDRHNWRNLYTTSEEHIHPEHKWPLTDIKHEIILDAIRVVRQIQPAIMFPLQLNQSA